MIQVEACYGGQKINIPFGWGTTLPTTVTNGMVYAITAIQPGNVWYNVQDMSLFSAGDIGLEFAKYGPALQLSANPKVDVILSSVWQMVGTTFTMIEAYYGVNGTWEVVSLPVGGLSLADATWQQIKYIADHGEADKFWKIGDRKSATYSTGISVDFEIIDFWHDEKASIGGGKAPITFAVVLTTSDISPVPTYQMNFEDTNSGGWGGSQARKTLNDQVFAALPQDLQAVICPVQKTYRVPQNALTYTSLDKLFIPASVEYGVATGPYVDTREGFVYAGYAGQSPGRFASDVQPMWTRTVTTACGATRFVSKTYGSQGVNPASSYLCRNYAFCI